jgi:site-specific DNA-methyltransferase (adenine-specific)
VIEICHNIKAEYPTQKPKALIERIIKASSNEGDIVADYYLGSGTTAVVCKELNRNFIGCDINPKAIEITNARLDAVS